MPFTPRKNIGKRGFRGAEGATKKLEQFLEIFGKFINENAIKVIFGVALVEISRKFPKIPIFGRKLLLHIVLIRSFAPAAPVKVPFLRWLAPPPALWSFRRP